MDVKQMIKENNKVHGPIGAMFAPPNHRSDAAEPVPLDMLEHGKKYRHTRPSFGPNTPDQIVEISLEDMPTGDVDKDKKPVTAKVPHFKFTTNRKDQNTGKPVAGSRVFPIPADSVLFPMTVLIALLMAAVVFFAFAPSMRAQTGESPVIGNPQKPFQAYSCNVSNGWQTPPRRRT
jgi:hypothetical protein